MRMTGPYVSWSSAQTLLDTALATTTEHAPQFSLIAKVILDSCA
jgi:hypothetical protein